MKTVAAIRIGPRGLRVLIHARGEARRAALEGFLALTGHDVVAALAEADVVLADGDYPPIEGTAVLTLGGTNADYAGSLESDATAEQIDAAPVAATSRIFARRSINCGDPMRV